MHASHPIVLRPDVVTSMPRRPELVVSVQWLPRGKWASDGDGVPMSRIKGLQHLRLHNRWQYDCHAQPMLIASELDPVGLRPRLRCIDSL
jgi:hypothetical protein